MKLRILLVLLAAAGQGSAAAILSIPNANTFDVPVSISGVTDLYAFQFDLSFDPLFLHLNSVTEGSFLNTAGSTIFVPGTINNVAGTATFNADSLVGPIPGASGSGQLVVFHFSPTRPGNSPLTLSSAALLDSGLNDIAFSIQNGGVMVPEPSTVGLLACVLLREPATHCQRKSKSAQHLPVPPASQRKRVKA